ncbi:MAG TPA: glycosyltransferase [Caulobacteraceae bacterium]|nr:glycosyltransferase [Caulobacteraceae bacterium]
MALVLILGALPLAIWLGLLTAHGGFWLCGERDDRDVPPEPASWPSVTAVVPARDEADVIARSIGALLAQNYPGDFRVILVDDNSSDGTAEAARAAALALGRPERLTVLSGAPLADGWTGKLWAVSQGVAAATADASPKYLWLTDADIGHDPGNLRALVARAEAGGLVLTSLMVELHCKTWAERFLIPAFVFFFQMVYPFAKVNRPGKTAGAAGGCMLARAEALAAAGGIAAIRKALIDDCALGALMKRQGPIWLGLTHRARSLRPYDTFDQIGRMVSRSAYAQLDYSPLKLLGVIVGMALLYMAPVEAALIGHGLVRWLGLATWLLMALSFQPMLRFYRMSPLWGLALPAIGAAYTVFTVQSAVQVWRGEGGLWKGRAQAMA